MPALRFVLPVTSSRKLAESYLIDFQICYQHVFVQLVWTSFAAIVLVVMFWVLFLVSIFSLLDLLKKLMILVLIAWTMYYIKLYLIHSLLLMQMLKVLSRSSECKFVVLNGNILPLKALRTFSLPSKSNPAFLKNIFLLGVLPLSNSFENTLCAQSTSEVLDFHHINYWIILLVTNTYWNYNCFCLLNDLN